MREGTASSTRTSLTSSATLCVLSTAREEILSLEQIDPADCSRSRSSMTTQRRSRRDPRYAAALEVSRLPEVMDMPRTREQLRKAVADTDAWLDSLDPRALASPDSDGTDLRAIGDALRAVAAGDLALAEEVARARANGRTWTQIAAVLGVTKQAARERFGEPSLH